MQLKAAAVAAETDSSARLRRRGVSLAADLLIYIRAVNKYVFVLGPY